MTEILVSKFILSVLLHIAEPRIIASNLWYLFCAYLHHIKREIKLKILQKRIKGFLVQGNYEKTFVITEDFLLAGLTSFSAITHNMFIHYPAMVQSTFA